MKMVDVGNKEKKTVSELNHKLYKAAKDTLDPDKDGYVEYHWHIGWRGVGKFIDWLEENYEIREKSEGAKKSQEKLNTHLIQELTPLCGEEAKDFLIYLKSEIASNLIDVRQWAIDTPQEEINEIVVSFYEDMWSNRDRSS